MSKLHSLQALRRLLRTTEINSHYFPPLQELLSRSPRLSSHRIKNIERDVDQILQNHKRGGPRIIQRHTFWRTHSTWPARSIEPPASRAVEMFTIRRSLTTAAHEIITTAAIKRKRMRAVFPLTLRCVRIRPQTRARLSEGEFLPLFPPLPRALLRVRMTRRTKDDEKENAPHARSRRPQPDYTAPLVPVHGFYGAAPPGSRRAAFRWRGCLPRIHAYTRVHPVGARFRERNTYREENRARGKRPLLYYAPRYVIRIISRRIARSKFFSLGWIGRDNGKWRVGVSQNIVAEFHSQCSSRPARLVLATRSVRLVAGDNVVAFVPRLYSGMERDTRDISDIKLPVVVVVSA